MGAHPQHKRLADMIAAAEAVGKTVVAARTDGKDVVLTFKDADAPDEGDGLRKKWSQ